MPVVLMNFDHYNDWVVHFIQSDCRTTIGAKTRYFTFAALDNSALSSSAVIPKAQAWRSSTTTSGDGPGAAFTSTSPQSSMPL
jgi:hypothetical protein